MRKLNLWVLLLALVLATPLLAGAQSKPSKAQKDELDKAMEAVQNALKAGDADKIKEAKDNLIKLTDEYYKIPKDNVGEEPSYDPDEDDFAAAGRNKKDKKKVDVKIGEAALFNPDDGKTPSIPWLAAIKIHEIIGHGSQAAAGKWYTDDKGTAIQEVEAWGEMLKHDIGLSESEKKHIKDMVDWYRSQLNEANQKKVDNGDFTMAFAPPSDKSQTVLSGKVVIFVSGEVYADELATATVRGPRTLEGYVITTEAAGQTAQAKTDRRGGSRLSLPNSVGTLPSGAVVIVRALDSAGKEVARTQTRVLPGPAPDVVNKPVINSLPPDIRRGDVITIPGSSLGPECEMIVGNQVQETLAASIKELTAYVDTPTLGPQDAWVRNPYGESKSFQTNVYSFEVSAPRTTIRKGEDLTATAQYQSLRPGSEIHFKNNTEEIVLMNIAGARTAGNQAVVVVQKPNGTIPVNLKGVNAGAFSISYEVISPPRQ